MDPDVVEHDPAWARSFEIERVALLDVLGDVLTSGIEHVGSTSVPGLRAKPIIDMLAGVVALDRGDMTERLAASGYGYEPHRPAAQLFVKIDPAIGLDTHHLHLTVPGSDLWVERLAFRDALRADPELVRRYAEWKQVHLTTDPARRYDATKTDFVREVLAARGIPLLPDRDRLTQPHPAP